MVRMVLVFAKCVMLFIVRSLGSDVFSTSSDGQVMWWDIRKLGEPVETLTLEFPGYKPGEILGGIALEYESTMVRQMLFPVLLLYATTSSHPLN